MKNIGGRPYKQGLDYFSIDIGVEMDRKYKLLKARYGLEGIGFLYELLRKIYLQGYYLLWSNEESEIFCADYNIDRQKGNSIVSDCANWNWFDIEIYEKYNILTSHGIQKRYTEAARKRSQVVIFKDIYLLNGELEHQDNIVFTALTPVYSAETLVNSPETLVNSELTTQSKEKKSREEKFSNSKKNIHRDFILSDFYDTWISLGLKKHLRETVERNLHKRHYDIIKLYGEEKILAALRLYAQVTHGKQYWYTGGFDLWRFIEKIESFLPEADPLTSYLDSKNKSKPDPYEKFL